MKAKYARQIRRGIIRANADIHFKPHAPKITTELEVHTYHKYMRRYFAAYSVRIMTGAKPKGMEL